MALRKPKNSVKEVLGKTVPTVEGISTVEKTETTQTEVSPASSIPLNKPEIIKRPQKVITKSRPVKKVPVVTTGDEETVTMQTRIVVPANGVSSEFDKILNHAGVQKAASVILSKALDEFVDQIRIGEGAKTYPDYEKGERVIQTTRRMDNALYNTMKEIIDPLDIEKPFKVSNEIVHRALCAYFSKRS